METLELQLKSADDVLKTVATQLGVDASDLKVTILDEQSGLFGKKKFKVQVERLGAASAEVEEVKAPRQRKQKPRPKKLLQSQPLAVASQRSKRPKSLLPKQKTNPVMMLRRPSQQPLLQKSLQPKRMPKRSSRSLKKF